MIKSFQSWSLQFIYLSSFTINLPTITSFISIINDMLFIDVTLFLCSIAIVTDASTGEHQFHFKLLISVNLFGIMSDLFVNLEKCWGIHGDAFWSFSWLLEVGFKIYWYSMSLKVFWRLFCDLLPTFCEVSVSFEFYFQIVLRFFVICWPCLWFFPNLEGRRYRKIPWDPMEILKWLLMVDSRIRSDFFREVRTF